jgi:hypothetical protein
MAKKKMTKFSDLTGEPETDANFITELDPRSLPILDKNKLESIPDREIDWDRFYHKYPELTPDSDEDKCRFSSGSVRCNKIRISGDRFCIKHTKRDLTKYDIPWMCEKIIGKECGRKGYRCTKNKLKTLDICKMHYLKSFHKEEKTELIVENRLDASVAKAERKKAREKGIRSNKQTDWALMPAFRMMHPSDLLILMTETINRVRFGTIPNSMAYLITDMAKAALEMTSQINELMKEGLAGEERKAIVLEQKAIRETACKIFSLRDKMNEVTERRRKAKEESESAM